MFNAPLPFLLLYRGFFLLFIVFILLQMIDRDLTLWPKKLHASSLNFDFTVYSFYILSESKLKNELCQVT